MEALDIGKAVAVRILFGLHSFLTLWRVVAVKRKPAYWYMAFLLWPMMVEMAVSIIIRKGKEYKWFCPSVFFYLLSVIPSIWLLELNKIDASILQHKNQGSRYYSCKSRDERKGYFEAPDHDNTLGVTLPIRLTKEGWILTLEQLIVFMLIFGRWLLPKGELSRDQLSQILLVYIGTAADIMEIFEAFQEDEVRRNRKLCIAILAVWTWSFLQFTFVLTTSKSKKPRLGAVFYTKLIKVRSQMLIDLMGIFSNLLFQDVPFLILRVLLISRYNVHSIMSFFFTTKNVMVIVLELYRIFVLYMANKKEVEALRKEAMTHAKFKVSPGSMSKRVDTASTILESPVPTHDDSMVNLWRRDVHGMIRTTRESRNGSDPKMKMASGYGLNYNCNRGIRNILRRLNCTRGGEYERERKQSLENVTEFLLSKKMVQPDKGIDDDIIGSTKSREVTDDNTNIQGSKDATKKCSKDEMGGDKEKELSAQVKIKQEVDELKSIQILNKKINENIEKEMHGPETKSQAEKNESIKKTGQK